MKLRPTRKILFLGWKVLWYWDPKFKSFKKEFSTQQEVNEPSDKRIISLYEAMKASGKRRYQKRIAEYEDLLKAVKEHNEAIEKAFSFRESFSYEKILSDPRALSEEKKEEIRNGSAALSSFTNLDQEEKKECEQAETILKNYEEICSQFDDKQRLTALTHLLPEGYLALEKIKATQEEEERILQEIRKKPVLYYEFQEDEGFAKRVQEHNEQWLKQAAQDPFFDNVNGKSLDEEQREAILKPEKRNLVIAGAGSGKTLTICGKVKYLLEKEKVSSKDILLLSYSRKSADDLEKKVSNIHPDLKVATFHQLGLEILRRQMGHPPLVEEQFDAILESYFRDYLPSHPKQERNILTYYALYLMHDADEEKYSDEGELLKSLKRKDMTTLKDQLLLLSTDIQEKKTLRKERVRSYEELKIANWYFLNGINYVYEAPYERDVATAEHRQYKPDFYLKDYDVYHEHYGIGKDGKALQFGGEGSKKYVESMHWKRRIHWIYRTDCIETYSYEFQDGSVFEKLTKELIKRNIPLHPISDKKVNEALSSLFHGRPFRSFFNLIKSFLSLYKARYQDEKGFEALAGHPIEGVRKNRLNLFLEIMKDVYLYYRQNLEENQKIDFDDMILRSTNALDSLDGFRYQEILADEFQDISYSRMLFLNKLLEHGGGNLFAVGDDWQSIYRFAGSDLSLFTHFGEYFGPNVQSKITTTHRNSQELQDIVGPFIRKNPEQIAKTIHSSLRFDHPVKVIYSSAKKSEAFLDALQDIAAKDPRAKILVLGRNRKDFDGISQEQEIFFDHPKKDESQERILVPSYPGLELRYSTVHGAKGLEEDYVILINVDGGKTGFPNQVEDDPLLSCVLSPESPYPFAEERRLFYVALTRTRKAVYLIPDVNRPSIFLEEILPLCEVLNPQPSVAHENDISCPSCKSGTLVLRKDARGRKFYGCSNYPYCDYAIRDLSAVSEDRHCPICGDYLVLRKGSRGFFYGCHNYPYCRYTEEVVPLRGKHLK